MRAALRWSLMIAGLGLCAPAWAGQTYRFTVEIRSHLEDRVDVGRAEAEGDRYRLELDPAADGQPRPFDVLISTDAGVRETALNLGERTFYELKPKPVGSEGPLYAISPELWGPALRGRKPKVQRPGVELQEAGPETVAGLAVRRFEIRAAWETVYPFPGEKVKAENESVITLWLADSLALPVPRMLRPRLEFGPAEVRSRLDELRPRLGGFPVRQEVRHTVTFARSTPATWVQVLSIHDLGTAPVAAARFEVPAGFTFREPVLSGPGRQAD